MKKCILLFLIITCILLGLSPTMGAACPDTQTRRAGEGSSFAKEDLRFDSGGRFKIMIITDIQDGLFLSEYTKQLMELALDAEKPDLVVLGGDNIFAPSPLLVASKRNVEHAIAQITAPMVERDIPFALVMGNHDPECTTSKEAQMAIYRASPLCYAQEGPELTGTGNYQLLIRDTKGEKPLLNLWFLDSGGKGADGAYTGPAPDQLAWYRERAGALARENGDRPLPALLFQHIPVPEVYDALLQVEKGTPGAVEGYRMHRGEYYLLDPGRAKGGSLNERPCPPDRDAGQFAGWKEQGDVFAAFFGHDHTNDFVITHKGIDLVQTSAAGFDAYGGGDRRGVRMIELDAQEVTAYSTRMVYYRDLTDAKVPVPIHFIGEMVFYYIVLAGVGIALLLIFLAGGRAKRRKQRSTAKSTPKEDETGE